MFLLLFELALLIPDKAQVYNYLDIETPDTNWVLVHSSKHNPRPDHERPETASFSGASHLRQAEVEYHQENFSPVSRSRRVENPSRDGEDVGPVE